MPEAKKGSNKHSKFSKDLGCNPTVKKINFPQFSKTSGFDIEENNPKTSV